MNKEAFEPNPRPKNPPDIKNGPACAVAVAQVFSPEWLSICVQHWKLSLLSGKDEKPSNWLQSGCKHLARKELDQAIIDALCKKSPTNTETK